MASNGRICFFFLFLAEFSFWRGYKRRLASPGLDGHGFWRPVIYTSFFETCFEFFNQQAICF
jgi:hypothetical protein